MPRDFITLSSPTIIFPRKSHSYQTVGNMPLSVLVDPGATKSVLMIKASYELCLLEEIKKAPRLVSQQPLGHAHLKLSLFVLNVPLLGRDLLRAILA